MISVNKLHYWFIQGAHDTNIPRLKNLSAAQRDIYLNEAKDNLTEYYADLVETNDIVRQYLIDITVRDKVLTGKIEGDKYITPYPDDLLKFVKVYATAVSPTCNTPRRLLIRRMSSDKIERALRNSHSKRFWDFEETFGLESSRGLEVYHGDLTIQNITLDYVKRVPNVHGPSFENAERYITEDGDTISTNVNLEINNPNLARKIASLAVLFAHRDLGQMTDFQVRYQSITNVERAF